MWTAAGVVIIVPSLHRDRRRKVDVRVFEIADFTASGCDARGGPFRPKPCVLPLDIYLRGPLLFLTKKKGEMGMSFGFCITNTKHCCCLLFLPAAHHLRCKHTQYPQVFTKLGLLSAASTFSRRKQP